MTLFILLLPSFQVGFSGSFIKQTEQTGRSQIHSTQIDTTFDVGWGELRLLEQIDVPLF